MEIAKMLELKTAMCKENVSCADCKLAVMINHQLVCLFSEMTTNNFDTAIKQVTKIEQILTDYEKTVMAREIPELALKEKLAKTFDGADINRICSEISTTCCPDEFFPTRYPEKIMCLDEAGNNIGTCTTCWNTPFPIKED